MVTTYLKPQKALRVAQIFNTSIQWRDIEWLLEEAHMEVVARLKRRESWPVVVADLEDEDLLLLQHAEAAFLIGELARAGLARINSAEMKKQTQGKVSVELQNNVPMFFFGGADDSTRGDQIVSMLTSATPWQLGNYYVNSYIEGTVTFSDIFQLVVDRTSRGRGWNYPNADEDFT